MFAGLVPPKEFNDKFLKSKPKTDIQADQVDFSSVPTDSTSEKDLYQPLVHEFNKCCAGTGFKFFECASKIKVVSHVDGESRIKIRPDLGMLDMSPRHWTTSSRHASEESPSDTLEKPKTQAFDWSRCELSCEVKAARGRAGDPFTDDEEGIIEAPGRTAKSHRGQLISYYKEQASRQHRTFIFQIFIRGPEARFIRWDRSGAIVSKKFNYQDEPSILVSFIRRYCHLSGLRKRGWDVTKSLASKDDEELLKTKLKEFLGGNKPPTTISAGADTLPMNLTPPTPSPITQIKRPINKADKVLEGDYPTYTTRITCLTSHEAPPKRTRTSARLATRTTSEVSAKTTMIIRRPIYEPLSPFGRATRGYFAYDKSSRSIVFVKDTWRTVHPDPKRMGEGELCMKFKAAGIKLVPKVYGYGDYKEGSEEQRTLTDEFVKEYAHTWGYKCAKMRSHVHHFIVLEVLYPLTSFKNSKELTRIFWNILNTILEVHEKFGILHRDISLGNIMINANGEGVLGDWDSHGPSISQGIHPPFRTGTWQFMAISLLKNSGGGNQLWHDLESASLWTPLYTALHFLPHNQVDFPMRKVFDSIDENIRRGSNGVVEPTKGGDSKLSFLTNLKFRDLEFRSKPLQRLFQDICMDWTDLYFETLPYHRLRGGDTQRNFEKKLEQLQGRDYLANKFKAAFESTDWPDEDDKVPDQFPPQTEYEQDAKADTTTQDALTIDVTASLLAARTSTVSDPKLPANNSSGSRHVAHRPARAPQKTCCEDEDSVVESDLELPESPDAHEEMPTLDIRDKSTTRKTRSRTAPDPDPAKPPKGVQRATRKAKKNAPFTPPAAISTSPAGPSNVPGSIVPTHPTKKANRKRRISQVTEACVPPMAQKKPKKKASTRKRR